MQAKTALRLQVPQQSLDKTHYQLATGSLFMPTSHPLPPDTLLNIELEDEQGQVLRPGVARVVAWRTLLSDDETFAEPGMRLQLLMDEGDLPPGQDPAKLQESALQDVSEQMAARVDLDEADEITEPIPLPELPEDTLPALNFQDISELRAGQVDLDQEPKPEEETRIAPVEQRQHTRLTMQVPVRARELPDGSFFAAMAWNISAGGLFLRCLEELELGASMELEVQLPGRAAPMICRAEVVRRQGAFDSEQQPRIPGLALRFTVLPEGMRQAIEDLVKQVGLADDALTEDQACAPDLEGHSLPDQAAPSLSPAAHKKMVINALVTALEISRVEAFRDNATLRYLLEVWYLRYHHDRTVDLSLLWNTLAADETVSSIDATLPLYIFALARKEHGLGVRLPEGLRRFENCSQTMFLARRRISEAGSFRKVYDRVAQAAAVIQRKRQAKRQPKPKLEAWPRKAKSRSAAKSPYKKAPSRTPRLRKGHFMALLLLALMGLVAMRLSEGRRAGSFDTSEVATALKLGKALVQGDRMQAILIDERWETMNDEDRRLALGKLSLKLELEGIRSVLLFDPEGSIAASVRAAPDAESQPYIRVGHQVLVEPKK